MHPLARSLLVLILIALAAAGSHAQARFYLLADGQLHGAEVTPDGAWRSLFHVGGVWATALVVGDGGRNLYGLVASASQSTLARADLRTGGVRIDPLLTFTRGSVLVADPRRPGVYVVSRDTVSYVRDDRIDHVLPLPPSPSSSFVPTVTAGANHGRLFVARSRPATNDSDILALDLAARAITASRVVPGIAYVTAAVGDDRLLVTAVVNLAAESHLLEATTLATITSVPRPVSVALVDEPRGFVGELNSGTPFGGPGVNGPSGLRLLDISTLMPIAVVNPGMLDGNGPIAAVRPSRHSPLVVLSQALFPGYAGGPRDPRLQVLDGVSGRITTTVSLGSLPLFDVRLAGIDVPDAPTGLTATVSREDVTLAWQPSDYATSFVVDVGSAPGLTNIVSQPVGAATTANFRNVPPGIFVRVHGVNDVGRSASSNEIRIAVP